jgi:tetratricopeptide (TPR) repeat protein
MEMLPKSRIFLSLQPWLLVTVVAAFIFVSADQGMAQGPHLIKQVYLKQNSDRIRVFLTDKPAHKVLQIEPTEWVIAFNNTRIAKTFTQPKGGHPQIRLIQVQSKPHQVATLSISTYQTLKNIQTKWSPHDRVFIIDLGQQAKANKKQRTRKLAFRKAKNNARANSPAKPAISAPKPDPAAHAKKIATAVPKKNAAPPASKPIPRPAVNPPSKNYAGKLTDLIDEISTQPCSKRPEIKNAIIRCRRQKWLRAFELLNRYLTNPSTNTPRECLHGAHFLRAYAYYEENRSKNEIFKLESANYFQDAISYFPESPFVPYGLAALGKIHVELNNSSEAKGYFKMILSKYQNYAGTPEVYLELGKIYRTKGKLKLALSSFKKVLTEFPHASVISESKLELGKAYYENKQFKAALGVLNDVITSDQRLVFLSEDMLLHIGNSYYQIGKYRPARESLLQAYNLFPDMASKDLILARIADTYKDENLPEKAIKFYQLVVDKYPGSDGFLISSMRLAESKKTRAEKEEIYQLIIQEYPMSPMASLALLKTATLQKDAQEYEACITTIHKLMTKYPSKLKKEAYFVMQEAYRDYFANLMKQGQYTNLLGYYEKEKPLFRKFNDVKLFNSIGEAFYRGHLYKQAAENLKRAYDYAEVAQRTDTLMYHLGVAYHESGNHQEALKYFKILRRVYPGSKYSPEVQWRIGSILTDQEKFTAALAYFEEAAANTKNKGQKANMLLDTAKGYQAAGQYQKATPIFIQAINLMASLPATLPERIAGAYESLGENYLKQRSYLKAADALAMALRFNQSEKTVYLQFKLAEAYRLGEDKEQARTIYEKVSASGDPFWGRLAEEELRRFKIKTRLAKKR